MYLLAVFGLLFASIIYGLVLTRRRRAEMIGLPSPPVKYWLLGNLDVMAKALALFPEDVHAHVVFNYIHQKYNMPSVWYMDLWPVSTRFLFSNDPVYASRYATTGQSLPKAPIAAEYVDEFLGYNNLVMAEGAHWKTMRTIFNPGFSAAHLITLVPYMIDSSMVFVDLMRKKAETGEIFMLEEAATRLTIDIIGKVTLDTDFNSQIRPHPLVTTFRDRAGLMPNNGGPLAFFKHFQLMRRWKLWQNTQRLNDLVGREIDKTIAKRSQSFEPGSTKKKVSFKDRKRGIVDLALDAYHDEKFSTTAFGNVKPGKDMDAAFRAEAITSIKTFIFAGHDTSSSLIAYLMYLVHHHPTVHARLLSELRSVFPNSTATTTNNLDPASIASSIAASPHLVNSLPYMTACIKETLRLFPPASTVRGSPSILPNNNNGQPLYVPNPDTTGAYPRPHLPLTFPGGTLATFWPIAHMIHRNPAYFPDPESFVPERFLPDETPYPDALLFNEEEGGKEAFRAFERGPRSCIGEQLAMLETKILLALVLGCGLGFVATFPGLGEVACAVSGVDREKLETGEREGRRARSTVEDSDAWEWGERGGNAKGGAVGGGGDEKEADFMDEADRIRMKKWAGRTVEGYGIYQMLKGAGKPGYGMPGRMYLRE